MNEHEPLRGYDDLLAIFERSCGRGSFLLGVESEKIGVRMPSGGPISYDGRLCGVLRVFDSLCAKFGWEPIREYEGGPVVAIEREWASVAGGSPAKQCVTLEPGAQLELSGAPLASVHEIEAELVEHLAELDEVGRDCEMRWLGIGFRPLATLDDLPWVPKQRYRIMRDYFPTVGTRGLDMMRRTATVQVNLDYEDEADAMRKLRVGLKLAPLMSAIFANSPFVEGEFGRNSSERAMVWTDTDRHRTGLIEAVWASGAGFRDYVEWALDVPMYLFKREGAVVANTGQTFRSFFSDGYDGHRATHGDWESHLGTLFPEARLKTTIEMRSVDSLPRELLPAVPAMWAGLLYDDEALCHVESLCADWQHDEVDQLRAAIARDALQARFRDEDLRGLAESLLEIAQGGLRRRANLDARGRDETVYLEPIVSLIGAGRCPADNLRDAVREGADEQRRVKMIEVSTA